MFCISYLSMIYNSYCPDEWTFIDDQILAMDMCSLLDNQWELDRETRKSIWSLYLAHAKHKSLLLNNYNHGKSNCKNQKYEWN